MLSNFVTAHPRGASVLLQYNRVLRLQKPAMSRCESPDPLKSTPYRSKTLSWLLRDLSRVWVV
jgi:hypothetical protein